MTFLKNLFLEKKHDKFIEEFLNNFLEIGQLDLMFDIEKEEESENKIHVDLYGKDEDILLEHHGKLLKALQVFLSGALKNRMKKKEEKVYITVDSQGFLENDEKNLFDLAWKLRKEVLRKNKSLIIKIPLNAFQRRKIHQLLTKDRKVETRSIGEGVLKKIKIFPLEGKFSNNDRT